MVEHDGRGGAGELLAGRYRIVRLLSRGGMSRVYVAEDIHLGTQVAVKFYDAARFSGRPDEHITRRRFFREARLAASLSHANVVEVLDLGEDGGVPFMVQRLVDGQTLGALISQGRRPDLAAGVRVLLDVASGLGFAHAQGVLHRDLKPDNVILGKDGRALLLDFGLARFYDVSDTMSGEVVGTPAYIAPELLLGQAGGTASDVFSLGVTGYQYLTGAYPFRRTALSYAIAYEEAPSPRGFRPELPRSLEAILLRMLAKNPEDRYRDCGELGHDLEIVRGQLESPATATGDLLLFAWQASAEQTHLKLPFVGREEELRRAEQACQRAGAGRGSVQAVGGEAGTGKSRLVEEVASHARLRGLGLCLGQAVETGGSYPYQPFASLVRNWAEQHGIGAWAALERHLGEQPLLAGTGTVLAGLLGFRPMEPRDRDQIWQAMGLFFEALAASRPVLVVLEDLHLADAASLDLLRFLVGEVRRLRVFLLVTLRPAGDAQALVAEQAGRGAIEACELRPLAPGEVEAMVGRLLVEEVDAPALARLLLRESHGNPLFIHELLKLLKTQGALAAHGPGYVFRGAGADVSLPEGMRAVIERRLERLTPAEREVADVAAVLGEDFRADDIAAVARADRIAVLRQVHDLARRHHLLESRPGGYRFAHARVREVLYESLPEELRKEYHAEVAEALEASAGESGAARLASHYEAAGRKAKAALWHRRAGDIARRRFDYEDAAGHYRRALALGETGSEERGTRLLLGNACFELGRSEAACAELEAALAAAEAAGERSTAAWALVGLARVADRRGEVEAVLERVGRGLELLAEEGDAAARAELLLIRARALRLSGDVEECLRQHQAAVDAARREGAGAVLGRALYLLAYAAIDAGRLEAARHPLGEAEAIADASGDPDLGIRVEQALGWIAQAEGRPEEAFRHLEAALARAETDSGPQRQAYTRMNLAEAANLLGRYPLGRELAGKAAEYARTMGERRMLFVASINLLDALGEMGALEEAVQVAAEAEPHRDSATPAQRDACSLNRGAVLLEAGLYREARAILEPLAARDDAVGRAASWCLGAVDVAPAAERIERLSRCLADARPVLRARALAAVAMAHVSAGRLPEAEEALRSIPGAARSSSTVLRDEHVAAGLLEAAAGRPARAMDRLRLAADLARAQGARIHLASALLTMSGIDDACCDTAAGSERRLEAARILAEVAGEFSDLAHRSSFLARPILSPVRAEVERILEHG